MCGSFGGIGRGGMLIECAGCRLPILDKFLLNVLDRPWHTNCVKCCKCGLLLTEKCFSRDDKLFCRDDFFKRYGTKCSGCKEGISPTDLVRKARDKVFHLKCFICVKCRKEPSTGEELYVLDDKTFICREDYHIWQGKDSCGYYTSLMMHPRSNSTTQDSGSEEEDDDVSNCSSNQVRTPEANNNSLSTTDLQQTPLMEPKTEPDSEDQGSLDGDGETDTRDSRLENKSPDDSNNGSKRRGPRTTIKAKQLDVLKSAFSQTPKPTRHIREQLAKETGLPMRVIQVWFQNKRSKERRLKQLTSMGRGPFFGGGRKMRGFPLDDGHGFPFFGPDGNLEFGYRGPPFHTDFFVHHPPPPGSLPFNHPGGPMDGMPMPHMGGSGPGPGADFIGGGGMLSIVDQNPNFMNTSQGPSLPPSSQHSTDSAQHRSSPPDFMSSQGGGSNSSAGFSDGPQLPNEGMVW